MNAITTTTTTTPASTTTLSDLPNTVVVEILRFLEIRRDILNFGATCRAAHALIATGVTAQQLWKGRLLRGDEAPRMPRFILRNSTDLYAVSFDSADTLLPLMPSLTQLELGSQYSAKPAHPIDLDDIGPVVETVLNQISSLKYLEELLLSDHYLPKALTITFPKPFKYFSSLRSLTIEASCPSLFIRLVEPGIDVDFSHLETLNLSPRSDFSWNASRIVSLPNLHELSLDGIALSSLPNFRECFPSLLKLQISCVLDGC